MASIYDFGILGATPAGLAAACYLARQNQSVAVFASPHQTAESPLADWVGADFFNIPGLPESLADNCGALGFSDVTYHNASLTRIAEYHSRKTAGYFLQPGRLIQALSAAAAASGAKIKTSTTSPAIFLGDDSVQIVGSSEIRCRLLIVAQNRPENIITELSLPIRSVPLSPIVATALDIPLTGQAAKTKPHLHVVESSQRGELGMFFQAGQTFHLRLIRPAGAATGHAAELSSMLDKLRKAGLLPDGLAMNKSVGAVWQPPAGVALDLEAHVAKRCLLAGTAGGFADSVTGGTLEPTVRSALLAGETAIMALHSQDPQEALMQYKMSWRKSLAKCLRLPNTSPAMMMPLLLANSRIVSKFTHALLRGEGI